MSIAGLETRAFTGSINVVHGTMGGSTQKWELMRSSTTSHVSSDITARNQISHAFPIHIAYCKDWKWEQPWNDMHMHYEMYTISARELVCTFVYTCAGLFMLACVYVCGKTKVYLALPPSSIELLDCWVSHKLVKGRQRRAVVNHIQSGQ